MTVLGSVLLAAGLCLPTAGTSSPPDSLAMLWQRGLPYRQFLAAARERRAQWLRVDSVATVPDALVTRARNAGRWKLLVLTVHACTDSINVLPYLARLAELAPNLELRIADTTGGRWVMEAHRTPDHRAATPTVVLLDDAFAERGCWLERPSDLQRWYIGGGRNLPDTTQRREKFAWYERDAGRQTLTEIVTMIEAAGRGGRTCAG